MSKVFVICLFRSLIMRFLFGWYIRHNLTMREYEKLITFESTSFNINFFLTSIIFLKKTTTMTNPNPTTAHGQQWVESWSIFVWVTRRSYLIAHTSILCSLIAQFLRLKQRKMTERINQIISRVKRRENQRKRAKTSQWRHPITLCNLCRTLKSKEYGRRGTWY